MAILNREAILGADDRPFEDVDVPEWGGSVRIGVMSGTDRDAWDQALVRQEKNRTVSNLANIRARLVAYCAVDEAGQRIFSPGDVEALGQKSSAALQRVFDAARRLNGLGPQAEEEAKGNSDPGPSDAGS